MILQLNPTLPVETPLGSALAHFLIDYGEEHHLLWVCVQESGEIWTWENPKLRVQPNPSFNRFRDVGRNNTESPMDTGGVSAGTNPDDQNVGHFWGEGSRGDSYRPSDVSGRQKIVPRYPHEGS